MIITHESFGEHLPDINLKYEAGVVLTHSDSFRDTGMPYWPFSSHHSVKPGLYVHAAVVLACLSVLSPPAFPSLGGDLSNKTRVGVTLLATAFEAELSCELWPTRGSFSWDIPAFPRALFSVKLPSEAMYTF
jgi:hypothetical protein